MAKVVKIPARTIEPQLVEIKIRVIPEREVRLKGGRVEQTERDYHFDARINLDNRRERETLSGIKELTQEQLAALDGIVSTLQVAQIAKLGLELVDEEDNAVG